MYETPVKEPPVVKPDPSTPDDEPEHTEPVYKCAFCPKTDSDPNELCDPIKIA